MCLSKSRVCFYKQLVCVGFQALNKSQYKINKNINKYFHCKDVHADLLCIILHPKKILTHVHTYQTSCYLQKEIYIHVLYGCLTEWTIPARHNGKSKQRDYIQIIIVLSLFLITSANSYSSRAPCERFRIEKHCHITCPSK